MTSYSLHLRPPIDAIFRVLSIRGVRFERWLKDEPSLVLTVDQAIEFALDEDETTGRSERIVTAEDLEEEVTGEICMWLPESQSIVGFGPGESLFGSDRYGRTTERMLVARPGPNHALGSRLHRSLAGSVRCERTKRREELPQPVLDRSFARTEEVAQGAPVNGSDGADATSPMALAALFARVGEMGGKIVRSVDGNFIVRGMEASLLTAASRAPPQIRGNDLQCERSRSETLKGYFNSDLGDALVS
jgi:hypothetical protein